MKVLIAGGGIGGLTAALCCLHFGHDVTVFEQAADLTETGAGLQIPPNAMKVFEALGLSTPISANAFQPEFIEARMGITGRAIFSIPLAQYAIDNWGAPYLHIHRADYIKALSQALQQQAASALQLNSKIASYQNTDHGVTLTLKDGREFSGDLLIGADGIKSEVRTQMLGPDSPRFTGNIAWRIVAPVQELREPTPNPSACVWMGPGRHGVTYLLRRGELANFVGVVEQPSPLKEGWQVKGRPAEALKDFKGWHPIVRKLIEAADPDNLYRWALFDRPPLTSWVDGQVALLGDAAHPMLPFLAQGAAMAVEDSWTIAREISEKGRPIATSLHAYEKRRYARVLKVQNQSRANMTTFHRRTKLGQLGTYGPMWLAGRLLPTVVHRRMDWLYGYDVTRPDGY